jgi:methylmalonyl-CoA/ethylmalonyl-CoA epimerase
VIGLLGSTGIHHVGLAVTNLDESLTEWTGLAGGILEVRAELPEQGVEAAAIVLPDGGEIELICPLDPNAPGGVAKFLRMKGPGLHHIALSVPDVSASLSNAKAEGVRLIDDVPRLGLHGVPIAFLHPSAGGGVLVELIEHHLSAGSG